MRFRAMLLMGLLISPSATAWEWLPEFQSLTEEEQSNFETPIRISPRYTSDSLAYLKPESWEHQWLSHKRALDLSLGSVSAAHFLIDGRLKVHAELAHWLEFRFTSFREQNLERDSAHEILELVIWPYKHVGLSLYGEPALYKRKDDTGLALLLKPQPRHEIRIFNTFVDVTRLKRNDRTDTYIEPFQPYSRGLVGRLWAASDSASGDFIEYAFRQETKTRWLFPDQGYEYAYWRAFASIFGSKALSRNLTFTGRLQWDRKFESINNATSSESWRTDRVFTLVRAIFPHVGPKQDWTLTLGFQYALRFWQTDPGTAFYRDYIPHFWLSLPAFGSSGPGGEQDHWAIGMDADLHYSGGPSQLFLREERSGVLFSRLNLLYEFQFEAQAMIRLMVSADLNNLGTTKTWGGGNGQFVLLF